LAHAQTASHAAPAHGAHAAPAHAEQTSTGLGHRKLLMWTFLGSECMFFGSLIATYLVYRNQSIQGPFPDKIIDVPITSVSTFVLLMSSLSMVLALNGIQRNMPRLGRFWTLMTAALGSVFLTFQVFEFYEFAVHGLTPKTNLFGTTFFTLTGFHGAHVTLGVVLLLLMAFVFSRSNREKLGLALAVGGFFALDIALLANWLKIITPLIGAPAYVIGAVGAIAMLYGGYLLLAKPAAATNVREQSENLEITGLYWHFVDIVWIIIFTVVYLISANDGPPPGLAG
jgi:heme/copper-type cytochrome/quinol oxidase subunit 3